MRFNRQNTAVLIYSIALLAVVGGVFLTSSTWDEERTLKWMGALSGWMALVVGVITIIVLASQLKEQRAVTRFTIGDIPPDLFQAGKDSDQNI